MSSVFNCRLRFIYTLQIQFPVYISTVVINMIHDHYYYQSCVSVRWFARSASILANCVSITNAWDWFIAIFESFALNRKSCT